MVLVLSSFLPNGGAAEKADEEDTEVIETENVDNTTEETNDTTTINNTTEQDTVGEPDLYPITATKKVTENHTFELYLDEANGNLRIINKKTDKEWLGTPQVDKQSILPNNKSFMDSPIHIKYTDGASISQTYTLKDPQNAVAIESIDQGVQVKFDVKELNVSFDLEYRLLDDGFEVTLPYDSLKEEGTVRLLSLEVLPFFNAAKKTDEGALFVPDGSGALMVFREDHPLYYSGYSQPIYGPDHTFASELGEVLDQGWTRSAPPKENIALPVFGNYRNNIGFLGIVTKGEEDANINATPSGIRGIPIYRSGVEFMFRKQDVMFIGSSGRIPLFQGNRIEGDRKVRYILLDDQDANYVGMANTYRNYLINEVGVKPVVPEDLTMNVSLLGGILREDIIGSTFIEMTTFEQVRTIIDSYLEEGVDHLNLTLKGWSKNGLYGNQPNHFPAARQLGGNKELQRLSDYADSKGISLHLETNYVRPFNKSKALKKRTDVVRGIDREVMDSPNYFISSRFSNPNQVFYLMKPEKVYQKHIVGDINKFKDLGISGIHFSYMGNLLYSDQDPNHLSSRKDTIEVWVNALNSYRENVGRTTVDYGFAYTLANVDQINNIPVDSSHFVYLDQTVPFYQIALHGLIPYTAAPANLRNDDKVEFLRSIEYGTYPNYELTFEPTSKMRRTMEDRLFSSEFSYWFGKSVDEYKRLAEIHQKTYDQPIVGHEQLTDKLVKVTYGNGVEIIINYGNEAINVSGVSVQAYDYTVIEGGRN